MVNAKFPSRVSKSRNYGFEMVDARGPGFAKAMCHRLFVRLENIRA